MTKNEGLAMPMTKPSIFRRQALEHYVQSREKTILPHLARPPAFLMPWILLILAALTMMVTSFGRVPVYISGSGIGIPELTAKQRRLVIDAVKKSVVLEATTL